MPDEIGQINVLYKLLKSCFVATYLGRSATMSWIADQSLSEETHKKTQIKTNKQKTPDFLSVCVLEGWLLVIQDARACTWRQLPP